LLAAGLIDPRAKRARLVKRGEISRAIKLVGIAVTAGAKTAILAAGGSVE
jgi:large subunit ribosomal protein L15